MPHNIFGGGYKLEKHTSRIGGPTNREGLSKEKAKEMLKHGSVHGEPLTRKQRGFFGAVASGKSTK